uniref:Pentatricopeptide repeat-containing protein At4g18520 n=1 Tax=Rhizophora mucronata TaxID=61149 RepID=A0A2P2Q3J9_RHIMU
MLSLTNVALLQQPSPLSIQPIRFSKPKTVSRAGRGRTSSHSFSCHVGNDSPATSCFRTPFLTDNTPIFEEFPPYPNSLDSDSLALWLRSCCNGIKDVKRIHALVLKRFQNWVPYVNNNVICAYLKLGELTEARKVFDGMRLPNVVSWTAMINGYSNFGLDDEALRLFNDSVNCGVMGNSKTFVCMLNVCGRRLDFELGRQIHACIVKGNWKNLIVDSAIVYFYAQCGDLESALCAFDRMVERDVVSWTTVITACSQQGCGEEAFGMFSQMLSEGFWGNEFTACSVLTACGEEKALKFGRQLHGAMVKRIYKDDLFIETSLVDMYAKCGEILDSRKVFKRMKNRNTVTWTSLIAGYARKGLGDEAINIFRVMKRRKIISNNLTTVSVLRACGSTGALLIGKELHGQIVKYCITLDEYLGSTLVWFYCKCGESCIASKILQQMPLRDVFSWTAIISGYACLGHEPEALEFLKEMIEEGVEPNPYTYSSALKACANLESVLQGKLLHSFANKTSGLSNVFVGSALIHMYSKCGHVSEAFQVFNSMPERNLVSWKAMIMGYAKNGLCQEALKLIYRMQAEDIEVDDYTFATVIGSCGYPDWNANPPSGYCLQSR